MFLKNGRLSKSPKWLYVILPTLLFAFIGVNLLMASLLGTTTIIRAEIAEKGELLFLLENLVTFAFFLVILLLWVRYVHRQPLRALFTARPQVDWKRFWFAFILWGSITVIMAFSDYFLHPENYQWNFQWILFFKLLLIVVIFIPLQTTFEEVFFRAYLMQAVGLIVSKAWFPLIFTSVTFGLLHIANPEVEKLGYGLLLYYVGTGIFLGLTTLLDDGIELALGFHAANNLFTALLVTSDWTVFQVPSLFRDISEPTLGWSIWVPLCICFPFLLWLYARKYHWKETYKQRICK